MIQQLDDCSETCHIEIVNISVRNRSSLKHVRQDLEGRNRKNTFGDIHWRRVSRIIKRAGLFFLPIVKVSIRLQTDSQRPQYLILIRWVDGPEKQAIKVASICIDEFISTFMVSSKATSVFSPIILKMPITWGKWVAFENTLPKKNLPGPKQLCMSQFVDTQTHRRARWLYCIDGHEISIGLILNLK